MIGRRPRFGAPAPAPACASAPSAHAPVAVFVALAIVALTTVGCGSAAPGRPLAVGAPASLPRPTSSRAIVIVMGNAEYGEVIGSPAAPYMNALARRYGVAGASYAITHPSLPNYLALTSGATQGVSSDCTSCQVSARNVVDELEAAGVSWAAYLEDVPGPCFEGAGSGGYAKKHNPFAYYEDVASSRSRCSHLVGFGALAAALRSGRLPSYVWISPNLCDDGHDCGVAGGDRFLARTVPALLRGLGPHGFLVITWDEGTSDRGCCADAAAGGHIATVVAGPDVRPGARESDPLDHYGVLGSVEQALGLGRLGASADPRAGSLGPLFSGGRVPSLR